MARTEQGKGNSKQAETFLDWAIDLDPMLLSPDASTGIVARGVLRRNRGDFRDALADFNRALAKDPTNIAALLARGALKGSLNDQQGAVDDFSLVIACNPEPPLPHCYLAAALVEQRNFAGAQQAFDEILPRANTNPWVYSFRAKMWNAMGDTVDERADLERLAELDATNQYAVFRLGTIASHDGDFKTAIDFLDQAVERDPARPESYIERATAWQALGNFPSANDDYQKALQIIGPDNPSTGYFLVEMWVNGQRLPKSAKTPELTAVLRSEDEWLKTVAQFLIGAITEKQLNEAADRIVARDRAGRICEERYFQGVSALLRNDLREAAQDFRDCLGTGKTDYYENLFASAELARLP